MRAPALVLFTLAAACRYGPPPGPDAPVPPELTPAQKLAKERALDAKWDERIAVRHLVVAFAGHDAAVTRTREEARARAEQALALVEKGAGLGELAAELSDEPGGAQRRGRLGLVGRGQLPPKLEAVAFALPEGGRSGVVETEAGFELVEREHVYRAREMLFRYVGALRAHPGAWRSRARAKADAEAALREVRAGADFAALAVKRSENWDDQKKGGDLGPVAPGELPEPLDGALRRLGVGEVSGVIDTPFGYVLLLRTR